jgi:hypothetical protein
VTQPSRLADEQIRSMLAAFAGPPAPLRRGTRRRRRATGRTVVLLAIALAALVLAVPGGLALLSSLWETPKQFLADRGQPAVARQLIRREQESERTATIKHEPSRLREIMRVLTAPTPQGDVSVYLLRFHGGDTGYFFTGPLPPGVSGGISVGSAYLPTALVPPCPRGWVLQYVDGGGGDSLPRFKSDGYVFGHAAARVASIHVLYRNGSTTPGSVANGFFFTSIKSSAANTNVTIVADNHAGKTVGQLVVGGYGGSPFPTSKPWPLFICAR